ncbi:MAG: DUF4350 domain-containing protein [Myxococcota bacterium]
MRNRIKIALSMVLCVGSMGTACPLGGKSANPHYVPDIPDPLYASGQGPTVLWHQWHTTVVSPDRYRHFLTLAKADGFVELVSQEPLDQIDFSGVAVVAIFLPDGDFTPDEVAALWEYVEQGGSVFIAGDHHGHADAVNVLTAPVGVVLAYSDIVHLGTNCSDPRCPEPNPVKAYTFKDDGVPTTGMINPHPITEGIPYLQTYNGSAVVDWPEEAEPLLVFGSDAFDGVTGTSLEGGARIACGTHGFGRYCVSSETQVVASICVGSCAGQLTGFGGKYQGTPDAEYNEEFALRLIRWLAGEDDAL